MFLDFLFYILFWLLGARIYHDHFEMYVVVFRQIPVGEFTAKMWMVAAKTMTLQFLRVHQETFIQCFNMCLWSSLVPNRVGLSCSALMRLGAVGGFIWKERSISAHTPSARNDLVEQLVCLVLCLWITSELIGFAKMISPLCYVFCYCVKKEELR